jgi:hypothetical protein
MPVSPECDDERRTGGFEVLRFVPRNQMVVLGIIKLQIAGVRAN